MCGSTADGGRACPQSPRARPCAALRRPGTGEVDVPIPHGVVLALRQWRRETEWPGDTDLVFHSQRGTALRFENVRLRYLRPAAEAGAPWAGFHTCRQTAASLPFARGANAVQVQKWLGHHSPDFTLDTYVRLLSEDTLEALDVTADVLPRLQRSSPGRSPGTNSTDGRYV